MTGLGDSSLKELVVIGEVNIIFDALEVDGVLLYTGCSTGVGICKNKRIFIVSMKSKHVKHIDI